MLQTTTATARSRAPQPQQLGSYRLRFAHSAQDLDAVLRLRFEVFNVELNEGLAASWATGRDEDEFDPYCDHLIVEDTETAAVIGTYRMQTWEDARDGRGFYSAGEFGLDAIPPAVLESSIEVGRACIAKPYRNRQALFLLWKGLASYMNANAKRYLFGCCSITSQDPAVGVRALADLERDGHLHPSVRVSPLPGLECRVEPGGHARLAAPVTIPILFGTYLRYGAKVCGPPAIDRAFGTIDFLALLDVADLSHAHRRLFF